MQNVTDVQKQQAISDYARKIPGMGANAARFGGLGGTRNALMESEAQRNLGNQLANIQATGSQNAFQNAQNQYNQAQNQMLSGAQLLGNMGQQQYNQQMGIAQGNIAAGQGLQNIEQQALNVPYQNYLNQLNYPYNQLNYFSGLIHGLPMTGSMYQTNQGAAPNMYGLIGNALMSGGRGGKAGGHVRNKGSGLGSLIGKAAAKR
jgi:hypothetical protein